MSRPEHLPCVNTRAGIMRINAEQELTSTGRTGRKTGKHGGVMEHPILFSTPMVQAILDGRKTMTRRVIDHIGNCWHYKHRLGNWELSENPLQYNNEMGALWRWMGKKPIKEGDWFWILQTDVDDNASFPLKCPYGKVGDHLWVRETWQYYDWTENGEPIIRYLSDNEKVLIESRSIPDELIEKIGDIWEKLSAKENYNIHKRASDKSWRPPIFMPRWASRITLEITNIRVERLQEITEEDALKEGIKTGDSSMGHVFTAKEHFKGLWDSINGKKYPWSSNPWVWCIEFKKLEKAA
jgi:hypothetical protein